MKESFFKSRFFLQIVFTISCYILYKLIGWDLMCCTAFGTIIGEQAYLAYKK